MTTAISAARATPGARTVRIAAAALLGALALTACDSGGGSGAKDGASATPTAPSTANSGGGAGSTGGTSAKGAELNGSWLATSGGKAVVLIITGRQAALFATDRTTCTGASGEESGKRVIHLGKCKARTTGTVDSVNKTTLQVTWEGGLGQETYTRSEGAALPSGLPTASLGS
ncbi:hypothetical protein ACJ6WE_16945 [Streptomyces sp. MMS24-I31]|uniref:hypothetical protein n=1 Tax=Streptomyces sp. MMS24-I31 TaxID=3351563 RepID=UPI003896D8A6